MELVCRSGLSVGKRDQHDAGSVKLREDAVALRRRARQVADQSDAFVHLFQAIELEAKADDLGSGALPVSSPPPDPSTPE